MQLGSSANKSKGNYGSGFAMGSFEVKSEINVTPLVDVCLVLLIIFMVVTPLLQTEMDAFQSDYLNIVRRHFLVN